MGTPLAHGQVPTPLPRLALVLGTEGEGVSSEMLGLATRAVFLPMYGFVQSLNVAVACGMLLQRMFDLCPSARGDLLATTSAELRGRLLTVTPRLAGSKRRGDAIDAGEDDLDSENADFPCE